MPDVCYVGNFSVPYTTENDVRRAFEALGWTVDCIQERDFLDWVASGQTHLAARRMLQADLVLHTMTQGTFPHAGRVLTLWNECAQRGIPTASIHLDLFYGLASPKSEGPQRSDLPAQHPMFKVQHVFTADGGHADLWRADGVNHHWLPPGVSHVECVDVPPIPEMVGRYDVGFIGSDRYHAEWPHRPQLVRWLADTYGARFIHAAGGSTRTTIRGVELNRVLASVPVWVGDSCCTAPDFPYWSDRVPETWGRGGFLIHPRVEALVEHYEPAVVPGETWECGNWTRLRGVIDQWLEDYANRVAVRDRLAAHTRAHDTYVNRVQTMLTTMGLDT